MERKPLYYLLASLACIVLLVMLIGGNGLGGETAALLEVESQAYPAARAELQKKQEFVAGALSKDPDFFAREAAGWKLRLAKDQKQMEAAGGILKAAQSLAKEQGGEARASIEQKLLQVRAARTAALADAGEIAGRIEKLLALRKNHAALLEQARADHEALQGGDTAALKAKVRRAERDWPAKKSDLEERLQQIEKIRRDGENAWQTLQAQNALPPEKIDFFAMATAGEMLHQSLIDFSHSREHLDELVDQLYISWEKVLVDMAVEENEEVRFLHKIQTTRIRVPGSGEEAVAEPLPPIEAWQPVSRAEYEKHKNDLGMALAVKPAGKYDEEAESSAAEPPGYAYIAPPEQGSNQYGHWVRDQRGGSFWEFYGKYAFLQTLFWGPSYRPIYAGDYRSYRRHRDSGRPYYGTTGGGQPRYGSSSASTRQRYGSSKYVRTDGFRGSRYEQSGGKYRGSKYETPAARSRGRTRSAASRQSSRRSSQGYRSSSRRRSSRSRGGK